MSKMKAKIILILFFIVVMFISLTNRYIYGTWNTFGYPERLCYGGFRYDSSEKIITLTDSEKPQYEISRGIDKFTGKKVYSKEKDFIGCGKVVYLYLGDDKYMAFASGGGG
ncbi:hypothetical protein [Clostridium beijerinckii]|uniref:hypothetical protein n=1 Tax=Clostridium beijerinckii TaxID=1520 RepID=UPI0003D3A597|nr:hypothetical protein [Clostridium beijerinckii]ALB45401.1 hypothetical protein X276_08980 [Clostridium beijerinckii NRRL B-598]